MKEGHDGKKKGRKDMKEGHEGKKEGRNSLLNYQHPCLLTLYFSAFLTLFYA
jgi:hypothetical protein